MNSPTASGDRRGHRLKGDVRVRTIEAALKSFSEHGYGGTSVRQIAAAVGVKPASLYNHFPSKEDLLWAIVEDAITELEDAQEMALVGVEGPLAQLQAFVSTHVEWHACNAQKARVVNARWHVLSKKRFEQVRAFRDRYENRLRRILLAGIDSQVFDVLSPRLTSYGILQMGMGIANWYRPGGEVSLEELQASYIEMALRLAQCRP